MQTVTSADGTEIAYERRGDGQPLVLVHGSSADRDSWGAVVPHLADEFTVVVPDRRGRGDSGDGDGYSLDREVADLRALVDAVDGDPVVVGHSFGGLVALAAAPGLSLDGLALYEPAVLVGDRRGDDLADRMRARIDDGDRLGALRLFVEEGSGVPDAETLPWWPDEAPVHRVDTVVRENDAVESFRLPAEPAVETPTLLLTGERGPDHLGDAVATLSERLPDSRLVELDGVGHLGTSTAPDRLAAEVREFARGD